MNSVRETGESLGLSVLTKPTPRGFRPVSRSGTLSVDRPRATALPRPPAPPRPRPGPLPLRRRPGTLLRPGPRRRPPRRLAALLLPCPAAAPARALPARRRAARQRPRHLRRHPLLRAAAALGR